MKPAFKAPTSPNPILTVSIVLMFVGLSACSTTMDNSSTVPPDNQAGIASPATFTGRVVETMNSGGYTYMRLQSDQKDVWIAAAEFSVSQGESVTAPLEMPMENFRSNTLNRDFPLIYFVSQVAPTGQALQPTPGAAVPMPLASHGPTGAAAQATSSTTAQSNTPPDGGLSIAETWARRTSLSGMSVTVRGTVVKVNNGIMDVNWFHLQDGSGKAEDGTNDLTVTSDAMVKVGDVVTASGTLGTQKDFGAGYSYEAILEKATIK